MRRSSSARWDSAVGAAVTSSSTAARVRAGRRGNLPIGMVSLSSMTVEQRALTDLAGHLGPKVKRSETLAPYTTFRIGGPADLFYEATTADDLANAVRVARQMSVPVFVLVLGANILVG